MRPDLVAVDNNVNPREYLGRFYFDSLVHDDMALKYLVDLAGDDKVMLGSDYPFPLGEHHPGKLIESMNSLSAGSKERLLWKNAVEFLGVKNYELQNSNYK